ncbi:SphA family protein [Marinobacter persicus]|uniref:MetA-pathway of phenol degradation n=1 Tax=Marinobacter persicus TaxID=930118 RepID=A0A2S6G705_9GAMM|nr:transporter [Marinobacter persicus]PPK51675.1 hypothetical protein BY455_11073 [Marinobacter persicus]PPK54895.1 hypothetical protein B0H24_100973 [Marinobacter persicus]PPK58613.1 hypothetical protein BY454_10873 [Marinobacter persicus]
MRTTKLLAAAGTLGLALSATPAFAVNGHYVAGIEGTKGPSLPPEGLYYRGYLVQYEIDSIQSDAGDIDDADGSVTAFANRFIYVTDKKFLGADYGMEAIVIAQDNDFDFARSSDSGIGDVFLGPLILGWHGQQWDTVFAAGHWFDTGDYDSTNPAAVGKGFGTTMLTLGGTWYFDEARDWSFSALSRYEIKTEQEDTERTPGDSWTVEWALGKVLNNGVEVALAGYDGWQLESDSGPNTTNAKMEQHAIGAEVTFPVKPLGAQLSGAVYTEYANKNRPEGNLFRLHLTKRF